MTSYFSSLSGLISKLSLASKEVDDRDTFRLPITTSDASNDFKTVDITEEQFVEELSKNINNLDLDVDDDGDENEFDEIARRINTSYTTPHPIPTADMIASTPYPGVHIIELLHTFIKTVRHPKKKKKKRRRRQLIKELDEESGGGNTGEEREIYEDEEENDDDEEGDENETTIEEEVYVVASRNSALFHFAVSQEIAETNRVKVLECIDRYSTAERRKAFFLQNKESVYRYFARGSIEFEYFEIDNAIVKAYGIVEAFMLHRGTVMSALCLGAHDLQPWAQNLIFSDAAICSKGMYNMEQMAIQSLYEAQRLCTEIQNSKTKDFNMDKFNEIARNLNTNISQYENLLKKRFMFVPGDKDSDHQYKAENLDWLLSKPVVKKKSHALPPPPPSPSSSGTVTTTTTQSVTTSIQNPLFENPFVQSLPLPMKNVPPTAVFPDVQSSSLMTETTDIGLEGMGGN